MTNSLVKEHRLYQVAIEPEPQLEKWLQKIPLVYAETESMGLTSLAPHCSPPRLCRAQIGGRSGQTLPMPLEVKKGITSHIRQLLDLRILQPFLSVKKPHTNDCRLVQNLRKVDKRVVNIHLIVPNPYTLLSSLPLDRQWYPVLDLKVAFFSLPLKGMTQRYGSAAN